MADKNIGSLVVMEGDIYLGILTERDYARKIILRGKSSNETKVSEIMSTDLPSVARRDSIEHCMDLMSELNVRYLPVLEGSQLVGILSIKDLVDEMILIQRETITHLQTYISGTY